MTHDALVTFGPWLVLAVGLGAVALTGLAFVVFLIGHLLGPKAAEPHGGGHGPAEH